MKTLLAILLLAFYPASTNVFSQTREEEFSGYAVRFQIRDELALFHPIMGLGTATLFTAPLLMSREDPPHYSKMVSTISVTAQRHGNEWDVNVSLALTKGGTRQMASGRLREGEKLRIDFSDYDLRPSEVSIAKIDPVPAVAPRIVNLTSSIEVANVKTSIVPVSYRILLKNASDKPIQGLELNTYQGASRACLFPPEGSWDRPLMEAGASRKFELPTATLYEKLGPNEYRPAQSDRIEIATVVFTDGTFEGNPYMAGIIGGKNIGRRVQLDRVLFVISEALYSNASLANFKEAISNLETRVEPPYSLELRNRVPMLDEATLKGLDSSIRLGLEEIRSHMLGEVANFEKELAKNQNTSFQTWLIKENEKFKTGRSRLPD